MKRYDKLVNCNWVDTRWQQYSTHLHTNSTQNNTMKQNTQNEVSITIKITLEQARKAQWWSRGIAVLFL